jgi:phospholipid/cholesterol/gamma-HCH transport system substrate-binding protein
VKRSREALVGVVIVAGVALSVFGTLWLQGAALRAPAEEIHAVFESVGQIRPGNPVKLRGVRVGRVRGIEVTPGGEAVRVTLRVEEGLPLPPDPAIVLSPESMFGDWQAEILSRDRFPAYRFAQPRDPDDLPGYAIPDISQLTATADRLAADIEVLTERVGIAFSEETAENIASLIGNVEDMTERLSNLVSQQAESFTRITDELERATQQVGIAATQAGGTFEILSATLEGEELRAALEDISVIAENFRGLSGELDQTNSEVRAMVSRIDSTFARVDGVLARAEAGEGSIGRLLHDPTMATEMEATLAELHLLLEDIRENPRRYLRLSIF